MYNLLENRNKSFADFKKFMDYMVKERAYINGLSEKDLDDFLYHYNKLPDYMEEFFKRHQESIIRSLANIEIQCSKIKDSVI